MPKSKKICNANVKKASQTSHGREFASDTLSTQRLKLFCAGVLVAEYCVSNFRNMNRHTFKDVIAAKRSSLANEVNDGDDDDDDREIGRLRHNVEIGEEESGDEQVAMIQLK